MPLNIAPVRAYVGLGSNLDGPANRIRRAFAELAQLPRTQLAARSPLYQTRPLGPPAQPDFINAVAALDTELSAEELLRALQAIEDAEGRTRGGVQWGPRTLDLDLLLYGDTVRDTPALVLPHPGLHLRSFVLYPLADLAPELVIPGHGSVAALRARCDPLGIELYRNVTA